MTEERGRRGTSAHRRAVLASLVGLGGCISQQGTTPRPTRTATSTDSRTATPTTSPTPAEPVRLGLLAPLSGAFGAVGEAQQKAARLAAQHVTDGGGSLDRPVDIAVQDTSDGDPGTQAGELIDDGVMGLLYSFTSYPEGWAEAAAESSVPLLSPTRRSPFEPEWGRAGELRYAGSTGRDARQDGLALGLTLEEFTTADTIALLYDHIRGDSYAEQTVRAFDGDVVARVSYDPNREGYEYGDVIEEAYKDDPDAVAFVGWQASSTRGVLDAWAEHGSESPWVVAGTEGGVARHLDELGVNQPVYEVAASRSDTPGTARFQESFGPSMTDVPAYTYDAAFLVALAAHAGGAATGPAVAGAIGEVSRAPGETVTVGEFDRAKRTLADGAPVDYQGASGAVDLGPALASVVPFAVTQLTGGRERVGTLSADAFEPLLA